MFISWIYLFSCCRAMFVLLSCYYRVIVMLLSCYCHFLLVLLSFSSRVIVMLLSCYCHVTLVFLSCNYRVVVVTHYPSDVSHIDHPILPRGERDPQWDSWSRSHMMNGDASPGVEYNVEGFGRGGGGALEEWERCRGRWEGYGFLSVIPYTYTCQSNQTKYGIYYTFSTNVTYIYSNSVSVAPQTWSLSLRTTCHLTRTQAKWHLTDVNLHYSDGYSWWMISPSQLCYYIPQMVGAGTSWNQQLVYKLFRL